MKTPDEIKTGLRLCPESDCTGCPYRGETYCSRMKNKDAVAYIEELEAQVPKHWFWETKHFIGILHVCSVCGYNSGVEHERCPRCGAIMDQYESMTEE